MSYLNDGFNSLVPPQVIEQNKKIEEAATDGFLKGVEFAIDYLLEAIKTAQGISGRKRMRFDHIEMMALKVKQAAILTTTRKKLKTINHQTTNKIEWHPKGCHYCFEEISCQIIFNSLSLRVATFWATRFNYFEAN